MPRHLISDAHEWINEIPSVPIDVVAYADDVLVIVEANSRAQLEVRCRGADKLVQ